MIALPGPPDEFQLVKFVMRFKGMQARRVAVARRASCC
jgi:hypothetical protein